MMKRSTLDSTASDGRSSRRGRAGPDLDQNMASDDGKPPAKKRAAPKPAAAAAALDDDSKKSKPGRQAFSSCSACKKVSNSVKCCL